MTAIVPTDLAPMPDAGVGRERVAKASVVTARKYAPLARFLPGQFNGGPGYLMYEGGELTGTYALGCGEGLVREIWVVRNPDKLGGLSRQRQVA